MLLPFARDPLEDHVGTESELYPNSAIANSSRQNFVLGSLIEAIQGIQREKVRGFSPEPELDRCVADLKAQKDELDSLSSDYFELVSAGPKNRNNPWSIPPGWCRGAYELIKKSREWETKMVTKNEFKRLTSKMDLQGLWDQCRTEYRFFYTWWCLNHKKYEELFCFAMLHHINIAYSFDKGRTRAVRNSLANIEQRLLRHLREKPQVREQWWIEELSKIQTSTMIQMSLFNVNEYGESGLLHHLRGPPNNLDTCLFVDSARLNVFGYFLYQDLLGLQAKIKALEDEAIR